MINKLDRMAQTLKIVESETNEKNKTEEYIECDANDWPYLSNSLEELKSRRFKNIALNFGAATDIRITRVKSDLGQEKRIK